MDSRAWIPASRLPQERIRVLVITDDRSVMTSFYGLGSSLARDRDRKCWRQDDRFEHPLGNLDGDVLWKVVGWMPLPPSFPYTPEEVKLRSDLGLDVDKVSIPLLEPGDPRIDLILGVQKPKPRPTVNRDGVAIEPDQLWKSMDYRDGDRLVKVLSVDGDRVSVEPVDPVGKYVDGHGSYKRRKTVMSAKRMHMHAYGWHLFRHAKCPHEREVYDGNRKGHVCAACGMPTD